MPLENVIGYFEELGVSMADFENFARAYDLLQEPFVQEVLCNWEASNASPFVYVWTEEDADMILNVLNYAESILPPGEEDEFEPWSLEFENEVREMEEGTCEVRRLEEGADEFEPWSPEFENEVREMEEGATSPEREGARPRKKFYCSRCQVSVIGYDNYRLHRETHNAGTVACNQEEPADGSSLYEPTLWGSSTIDVQEGSGEEAYRIERTGTRRFSRTVATETTYKVRFNPVWQGRRLVNLRRQLRRLFEDLLSRAREGLHDNDLLRIVLRHNSLNHAVVIPLIAAGEMSVDRILNKLENVLQSDETLAVDDSFQLIAGALHFPKGAGGPRKRLTKLTGPDNSIHRKTSMVQIVNDDNLCMARSIGVCFAKHCMVTDDVWKEIKEKHENLTNAEILFRVRKLSKSYYKSITNKKRREQKTLALALCQKAGVSVDGPGSLSDIPAFEEALRVRIAVVASCLGNGFIRVPINEHEDRPLLYLYMTGEGELKHFHAIVNIAGFFSANYFCDKCFKQYDKNTKHRCETTCITCKSQKCPETEMMISCRSCHMVCRSQECFERHLLKKPRGHEDNAVTLSQCDEFWRCTTCKKVLNRSKRPSHLHNCEEWLCKCCKCWVTGLHQCYLFPEKPKIEVKKFIFFDFEATQDDIAQCVEGYEPLNCCETPCSDCNKCQHCSKSWCGQPKHVPNFVIAQTVCEACIGDCVIPESVCHRCGSRCSRCDTWDKETEAYVRDPCPDTCGLREVMFQGDNTLDTFGNWLFSDQHKDFTVLAHNMKGYDGVFLLEYLITQSMRPSKIIYNGSKIMYMEVAKGLRIRILDSLNFLPMKLADLPAALGLTELCKGYFPHFFNKRENQRFVGSYPEPKAYGAEDMSTKDRNAFLKWHEEKTGSGEVFDFRKEMEHYCRSDVDILRRACLEFRQLMLDAAETDPFQYVTIASVCMGIFKTRFLEAEYKATLNPPLEAPENAIVRKTPDGWLKFHKRSDEWKPLDRDTEVNTTTPLSSPIAQVPSAGYLPRDNYSKASIEWLEYQMELAKRNGETLSIEHALNGGEASIFGTQYKVDGRAGNTVYEFHGCLWHGCLECWPDRETKNPKTGQSMDQLYALTQIKRKELTQNLRLNYVCIWEHDWARQIKEDPDVRDFVAGLDIQARLDARESFYGGRTNAAKLHYEVDEGEKIKYVDFTSLYPYVNKYSRYPIGHPEILTRDFDDINSYFGIAKVKILAPRGLYHPVLPYRSNGKLKFPLCRTCADSESRTVCRHNEEKRALTGTWCTPEIQKAISQGYTLLKIYEVYHWDESTQYDRATKRGGLFSTYVNTFLKIKQEASGWPKWCKSQVDKEQYISNYCEKEGIELDFDNIKENPGLRALAKLCLNSFWGKFGQRLNQGLCEFIHASQLDKFYKILTDRTKKIKDFHIINDDHLHLEYEHHIGFVPQDMKTNIFLATFTTCWARLKLYDVLDQVGDRVLYYDTDSVIYVSRPGRFDPPQGDYLGELTDELKGGDFIVEFVSGGPKNYAYTTAHGHRSCKIRGFSLNYTNAQLLNFDSVRDIVRHIVPDQPCTYNKRALKDDDHIVKCVDGTIKTCILPVQEKTRKRVAEEQDEPPSKIIAVTHASKIKRDKYKNLLYNKVENKHYRVVYDKRVVRDNLDTVPYGY